MKLVGKFQKILKPTVAGISILIIFSITFVISYIYFDYRKYLQSYHTSQTYEIEILQKKIEVVIEDLKKLLRRAEIRIYAANRKTKGIQGILISLQHLQAYQAFPEFQRLSYTKLSVPYIIVTRFGVLPLDHAKLKVMAKSPSLDKEPIIKFEDKSVKGSVVILNLQGAVEGILELPLLNRTG